MFVVYLYKVIHYHNTATEPLFDLNLTTKSKDVSKTTVPRASSHFRSKSLSSVYRRLRAVFLYASVPFIREHKEIRSPMSPDSVWTIITVAQYSGQNVESSTIP
ncbi:hypothetical protein C0J52_16784 [Blattella germanica]|nr:hypothetical protein C0J52_16784 [Blattella germanica]